MTPQSVLVLIKPDGLQKAVAGEVISLFSAGDLKLVGLKLVQVPLKLARAHYGHLRGQTFFAEIVDYLMGKLHGNNPVVAMVYTGPDAIAKCRRIAGATNPEAADPKSVRGKFGRVTTKGVFENLVHVSSDVKEARREIKLWFRKSELLA
ncbi:MAG: nucleoside-diphosphate kinase [Candidatus Omnitrophica bacterium]|nr:nucleoside-diphosphate kinase [Candidatus Omnitrophota bacterium]MDE2221672.1 nucleoside-diphosphate kinase [Candidatus Omnitrophota bacterium]